MIAGGQKDKGEDVEGLQAGTGYLLPPSVPALADMGDLGQQLVPGSQSSSVEPQFRSTSLNALAGTWTIPFSELVRCCCCCCCCQHLLASQISSSFRKVLQQEC